MSERDTKPAEPGTQTAGELRGMVGRAAPDRDPISVNFLARTVHASWLAERDRGYSPFAKPWNQLSPEARRQISRQARMNLDIINAAGFAVPFVDEYVPIAPGDARWADPER